MRRLCSTHLVELLNPSNQVRIAGGVLKIDVICRRGWGKNGKIRPGDWRARVPGSRVQAREDAHMGKWRDEETRGDAPLPLTT